MRSHLPFSIFSGLTCSSSLLLRLLARQTSARRHRAKHLLDAAGTVAAALTLAACGPTEQPNDPKPVGTEGAWTGEIYDDGTADETGDTDNLIANGCLIDPVPGIHGLTHQCAGYIEAKFGASEQEDVDFVPFGNGQPDDPYAFPKVLACCDEFDDSTHWTYQKHYKACWYGLARTLCSTIPGRIFAQATDNLPTGVANEIILLGNYVASDPVQEWCVNEFFHGGGIGALELGDSTGTFSHYFDFMLTPD